MAIDIPSFEYEAFLEELTPEQALEWATDLFSLATNLEEMPSDPREIRIVKRAIFQMAWYLSTDHENREEYMSEFSGERIGQYNYSKMYKTVEDGNKSDLPAFDFAVAYFADKDTEDTPMVHSEHLFGQPFDTHRDW